MFKGDSRLLARRGATAPTGPAALGATTPTPLDEADRCLLPAGQDAAFAAPLAARFATAGGVVTAMRAAVETQLPAAERLDLFGPASPFARAFGLDYPVAQGP